MSFGLDVRALRRRSPAGLLAVALLLASAPVALAQDQGWPRQRVEGGNTLLIYQPQVDDWKNFQELSWRMAISLTPRGGKAAVGIAVMKGQTAVDNDNKMVLITGLQMIETRFPSLDPDRAAQMDQLTRTFLPHAH